MARYDADVFFSAERERYPLPIVCPSCGKTMRPVHKLSVPDRPNTYVCTFCGEPFEIDDPIIQFREKPNHYDEVRSMTIDQMAEFIHDICVDRYIGIPPEAWREWLERRCNV